MGTEAILNITPMANFVKITTRVENGYQRTWINAEAIESLTQNSATQEGNNEGTLTLVDGSQTELIDFNATINMLG